MTSESESYTEFSVPTDEDEERPASARQKKDKSNEDYIRIEKAKGFKTSLGSSERQIGLKVKF